jgi:hypothetical protein
MLPQRVHTVRWRVRVSIGSLNECRDRRAVFPWYELGYTSIGCEPRRGLASRAP